MRTKAPKPWHDSTPMKTFRGRLSKNCASWATMSLPAKTPAMLTALFLIKRCWPLPYPHAARC